MQQEVQRLRERHGKNRAEELILSSRIAVNQQKPGPLIKSIHQTAKDLVGSGIVSKQTIRELDLLCLTPVLPMSAVEIRELRDREGVSQAVLARYINVTPNAVSQWERGEKRPSGAALKMPWLAVTKGLGAIQ